MIDVFEVNGRIGHEGGMQFYEQDTVRLRYQFHNDVEIHAELDYYSAGFGIVFEKVVNNNARTGIDLFLIKVGKDSFSVYRKRYNKMERLVHHSCFFSPPLMNTQLVFKKINNKISIEHNDKQLGEFELPRTLDQYRLSVYSNAGNKLRNLSVKNNVPDSWVTNIKNANGGRMSFTRNQVQFENCQQDGEMEQHDIFLNAGRYYVGYETEGEEAEFIVFRSQDREFDDDKKNILVDNQYFDLDESSLVNVRRKGKDVIVKNINIREEKDGIFIPTNDSIKKTNGSHFDIIIDQVKKAVWKGTIFSVPDIYSSSKRYAFLETSLREYRIEEVLVDLNVEYDYVFLRENMSLSIYNGEDLVHTIYIPASQDEQIIRMFKNINAAIREMVVTNNEDEEINIILQKSIKTFIPATQKDPILVYDINKEAFDLSSAYRFYEEDGKIVYQFTNWEREYFHNKEEFFLEKKARGWSGDIKVYGIASEEVDWENVLKVRKHLDNVDYFASKYDFIRETQYSYDNDTNVVDIDEDVLSKYKLFVIDYLKDDSYCINYNNEYGMYEVDIITTKEKAYVQYEKYESDGSSLSSAIDANILADTNKYVILREESK